MTMLIKGIADNEDTKAAEILQTVVTQMSNMLFNEGKSIKTSALNNTLQDLTFEYHPSEVCRRELKLNEIDWCGIHSQLLDLLSTRMEEMRDLYAQKASQYKIREDLTLTVTTLKKYLYFVQAVEVSNGNDLVKAADIILGDEQLSKIYAVLNQNLVHFWKHLYQTELIQILFEFSQKRTLQPFMLRDEKAVALFTSTNYEQLAKQNYQGN